MILVMLLKLVVILAAMMLLSVPAHAVLTSNVDVTYSIFKPKVFSGGTGISLFYRGFVPQFFSGGLSGGFSFRLRFVDP